MTKGFKSTEFWIAVVGTIAGIYMAVTGIEAGEIIAALSLGATYIGGRSFKKGMQREDD